MRFNVDLILKKKELPKDKNRIFISFLKNIFEDYDKEEYLKLYGTNKNFQKDYTFSLYLPGAKFERDVIKLSSENIKFNFSSYGYASGIMFYNSILKAKKKKFPLPNDNEIIIHNIRLEREQVIKGNTAIFTTMSPIVIREHNKVTNKDWYYSFDDCNFIDVLKNNLTNQATHILGFDLQDDVEELKINIIKNRDVKVKNYGIEVLANLATFELVGETYLLNFFYKAGFASKTSSGFGMLKLAN